MTFRTPQFPSVASLYSSRAIRANTLLCDSFPFFKEMYPFDDCVDPRGAFFRVTLPRWHTGTFVGLFWSRISCHVINGWSRVFKIRIISVAERPARRPLMIAALRIYSALGSNIATVLRIWLFTRSIFRTLTTTWRRYNIAENLNWNLSGFWLRTLYIVILLQHYSNISKSGHFNDKYEREKYK
jgi:hypothetical protein